MDRESVLDVSDVWTSFGANQVHRGVSFSVQRGTVTAVIGGSGCGKSVLLREIVGLMPPTRGKITLLGVDIWQAKAAEIGKLRARFGMLFQDSALFSALTVAENVALPLIERTTLSKERILELVDLRLALSGLSQDVADKMPAELSGGMRKRAGLARALALEPEVLFLDEPTSGLDPITARAFDRLIEALAGNLNITVLLVTHDLDTIQGMVNNLIVLQDGGVSAQGAVGEVMSSDNEWVREYFASRSGD